MTGSQFGQVGFYLAVLVGLAVPVGFWIYRAMEPQDPRLRGRRWRLDSVLLRLCGIDGASEMTWVSYGTALVVFNAIGAALLYLLQRLQAWLPLNPQHLGSVSPDTAFNTAVSFASNTSWQAYSGETTMSYLVQMGGIAVQSFLSAATGISVLLALLRGIVRTNATTLGNAWADLCRATVYVLLPLAAVLSVLLVSQGAIQNFHDYPSATSIEAIGGHTARPDSGSGTADRSSDIGKRETARTYVLPMGPAASQTSIALLSGDGGGFFNANSAHPYANPTALTNILEMLAILLIPAALCITFGIAVRDHRQGLAMLAAMAIAFAVSSLVVILAEQGGNPLFGRLGIDQMPSELQAGGNMEGKETRFGINGSALFAVVTTSGGDGAVNSMHESYTPIGGMVPLLLMQLGEVIFGGPGSGLYGMLVYAVLTVFIASLMIGRVPEYLGKHIDSYDIKMASIVVLVPPMLILVGTAVAVMVGDGRSSIGNPGAHGFAEVLYALSSTANNNGSAFAGLSANTPFYNVLTALTMWIGRFVPMLAVLAMAGSLARKNRRAPGPGTLPTHGPMFVGLLLATVIAVGALTFVPALAFGPIIEQLRLH